MESKRAVKPHQSGTFLGRKHKRHESNTDELGNDFQTRIQGTRVKHRTGPCSIKRYDKRAAFYTLKPQRMPRAALATTAR